MKPSRPVFADTDSQLRAPDSGLRILVAEDDPVHALIVSLFLERTGAAVVHVTDGQQAVAAAAATDFSLILMDYRMPGIDGVEATRRILGMAGAAGRVAPPIVALTASAMKHECQRYLDAGMALVLSKPVSMDRLADTVLRMAHPLPKSAASPSFANTA